MMLLRPRPPVGVSYLFNLTSAGDVKGSFLDAHLAAGQVLDLSDLPDGLTDLSIQVSVLYLFIFYGLSLLLFIYCFVSTLL